jgi:hypothetical protein
LITPEKDATLVRTGECCISRFATGCFICPRAALYWGLAIVALVIAFGRLRRDSADTTNSILLTS